MSQYSKQRIMNFNIFSSKYSSDVIIGQKAIPYVLHEAYYIESECAEHFP